ncbi:uncharacterized protein PHACADRAFT_205796 [Phanerochaete carnosa HHB-10118-sp]|uniref:FAD-binding domain-containing protein n=1 Tax=Phanerochaete carnosa (strain HHB-10118-sp) TaxID=650164 RepID=K5WK99_PHACS|nr:uncharacterized protein PHACADRAFT_205796 [Phanerochaete carnosa HHB-10118-sp]EKM59579.1 hypothetical protein PHACADRAFT_205796 [Phanerochaete carnosa HHB-10118-sp]
MSVRLPVLVVGAGPTGLISAISLLKNGVPVRIIEKRETFHGGIRGSGVTPRTLEVLSLIDVAQDVIDSSTAPLDFSSYEADGHTAKSAPWAEGAGTAQYYAFPEARIVSQAEFEALLRKHLGNLGASVETGKELIGFEQSDEKVMARILDTSTGNEETFLCSFLVGADGAKGRIRRILEIPFVGQTREEDRVLSGNVNVTGLDKEHWHMWGKMTQAAIGLRPMKTGSLFQMQALGHELPASLPTDLEGIRKLFQSISHRDDILIHDVEWVTEWRANIRMCEKFNKERVFLVGDAAHCHSLFGGQGMNSGIQDAMNLSWKLALVYHGRASMELLNTYNEERVPVIAEMLNLSSNIHYLAFGKPAKSALDGALGGEAAAEEKQATNQDVMHRPKVLLQLGVNCRWSPIVLETRADASASGAKDPYGQETARLRAGDRAPNALVTSVHLAATPESTTLHKLFDMHRHIVMVFVPGVNALGRLLKELEDIHDLLDAEAVRVVAILPKGTDHSSSLSRQLSEDVTAGKVQLLVDKDAEVRRVYDLDAVGAAFTYVVVRPDGVIGSFAGDVSGVRKYFEVLKAGGRP